MRNLFVLFLLMFSAVLSAQNDFRPGYIIFNSGDTLTGYIDCRSDATMTSICRFRENENGDTKEYTPDKLAGYRLVNGKYYISDFLPGKGYVFLEFLVQGKLNLYYDRDETGEHFFVKKEGDTIMQVPEDPKYVRVNDKLYANPPARMIGLLTFVTREAPELGKEINSIKVADQRNMVRLAVNYHNAVCSDGNCVVYTKKVPGTKVSVQPVLGLTRYKESGEYYNESGLFVDFWAPLADERLYFKTGLTFIRLKESEGLPEETTATKIPLHIRYLGPGRYVRPEISGGACLYFCDGFKTNTFSLSAGLNTRLHKEFYLHTGLAMETSPIMSAFSYLETFSFISHSFFAGVYYMF